MNNDASEIHKDKTVNDVNGLNGADGDLHRDIAEELADFTANRRVLTIAAFAILIGAIAA